MNYYIRYPLCNAYGNQLSSNLNHGKQTVSGMETVCARDGLLHSGFISL